MNVHCLFLYTSKIICSAWRSCWPVTFWFHSVVAPVAVNNLIHTWGKYCKCWWFHPVTSLSPFFPNSMYSSPTLTVSVLQWEIIVLFCFPNQSHCWGYRTFPHFETRWLQDDFATLLEDCNFFFFLWIIKYLVKKSRVEGCFFFLWFQILISNAENKDGSGGPLGFVNIKDLMFPRDLSELERTATESAQHQSVIMVRQKIHNHVTG